MSIGYINTGSSSGVNQNNIGITKYVSIPYVANALSNKIRVLQAYNSLPFFEVLETQLVTIVAYFFDVNGNVSTTEIYEVKFAGKGFYGDGETQLLKSNLLLISSTTVNVNDIESNPLTQIIEIDNLNLFGYTDIVDYILDNEAIVFQDVNIAPRLVKVIEVGYEADYLFLGVGGLYGDVQDSLPLTMADFQLLDTVTPSQNNKPLPIVYTLSDIGATSFNDDIPTLLANHIAAQDITISETEIPLFEVVEDPFELPYNFKATSIDWDLRGISDAVSFKNYLDGERNANGDCTVENFRIENNVLKCTLSNITTFNLTDINLTKISKCDIAGLEFLFLSDNPLESIDSTLQLPTSLIGLDLRYTNITDWSLSEAFASNQNPFGNNCLVSTYGNSVSTTGTNFAIILTSKNCTIVHEQPE
jgi:hypothetical protein